MTPFAAVCLWVGLVLAVVTTVLATGGDAWLLTRWRYLRRRHRP